MLKEFQQLLNDIPVYKLLPEGTSINCVGYGKWKLVFPDPDGSSCILTDTKKGWKLSDGIPRLCSSS